MKVKNKNEAVSNATIHCSYWTNIVVKQNLKMRVRKALADCHSARKRKVPDRLSQYIECNCVLSRLRSNLEELVRLNEPRNPLLWKDFWELASATVSYTLNSGENGLLRRVFH